MLRNCLKLYLFSQKPDCLEISDRDSPIAYFTNANEIAFSSFNLYVNY